MNKIEVLNTNKLMSEQLGLALALNPQVEYQLNIQKNPSIIDYKSLF